MCLDPEPARPDELPAAFQLLFRHVPDEDRPTRVAGALALVERGELGRDGIFVLRSAGEVAGVLACQPLPGAIALFWPPQCPNGPNRAENEDRLMGHVATWLRSRGVKLAQALFPPDAVIGADILTRNGFVPLTHLSYLRHNLDVPARFLGAPARLEFSTYTDDPQCFADTMLRSYEGTFDCPEINDVRTMDEVLAGHRAQGVHDPSRWWLATVAGLPVGVLLAALTRETGEWDVGYVGVIPEARRRGFGREMMLHVLFEARAAGVPALTLCVDGRNRPAADLYRDLGFEMIDRREVFLAIWR